MSMTEAQERRAVALDADPTLSLARFVVANPAALALTDVLVPLPELDAISLRPRTIGSTAAPATSTWIGTSDKPGGQSVLVVRDGEITGVIYDGEDQYGLASTSGTGCTR